MVLVGLLLTLIGVGNVYTGYVKTAQYEVLLAAREASAAREQVFTEPWRSPLLSHLRVEQSPTDAARAKLDFYRVVYTGGRLLTLIGMLCAAGGAVIFWHRQAGTPLFRSTGGL